MMLVNFFFMIGAFIALWFSAGLIIEGVIRLSRRLNISTFTTSFFLLGIITAIPEFSIGVSAIYDGTPDIFAGNLIGGSIALFALVIPILAIIGGGVSLSHNLTSPKLLFTLFVILSPVLFILDGSLMRYEGFLMLVLYAYLVVFVERRKNLLERYKNLSKMFTVENASFLGKIFFGSVILFVASKVIVDEIIFFTSVINISPFVMSLFVLGLGTNLPEISVALRSLFEKKKEIALGNYIGTASANTLVFGLLILMQGDFYIIGNSFLIAFSFFIAILTSFFLFTRGRYFLSSLQGVFLFALYICFIALQIVI